MTGSNNDLICECGFKFSGPGEFRNCAAFLAGDNKSGVMCPECGMMYVDGKEYVLDVEGEGDPA